MERLGDFRHTCPECGAEWIVRTSDEPMVAHHDSKGYSGGRISRIVSGEECECAAKRAAARQAAEFSARMAAVDAAHQGHVDAEERLVAAIAASLPGRALPADMSGLAWKQGYCHVDRESINDLLSMYETTTVSMVDVDGRSWMVFGNNPGWRQALATDAEMAARNRV